MTLNHRVTAPFDDSALRQLEIKVSHITANGCDLMAEDDGADTEKCQPAVLASHPRQMDIFCSNVGQRVAEAGGFDGRS